MLPSIVILWGGGAVVSAGVSGLCLPFPTPPPTSSFQLSYPVFFIISMILIQNLRQWKKPLLWTATERGVGGGGVRYHIYHFQLRTYYLWPVFSTSSHLSNWVRRCEKYHQSEICLWKVNAWCFDECIKYWLVFGCVWTNFETRWGALWPSWLGSYFFRKSVLTSFVSGKSRPLYFHNFFITSTYLIWRHELGSLQMGRLWETVKSYSKWILLVATEWSEQE